MTSADRLTLKALSDADLLAKTDALVREERRITIELLHHLREIESRMLYAERFASMHDYLTREFHYSEAAAQRRIQAMRALRELPELEEALQEGRLNLTTASQVQVFLRQEDRREQSYSREEKKELFEKASGLSSRETEKLLVSISPESALPHDREREVAPGRTQITFTADDELMGMLKQIRELASHRDPNPDYLALFKRMAVLTLQKMDPAMKSVKLRAARTSTVAPSSSNLNAQSPASGTTGNPTPTSGATGNSTPAPEWNETIESVSAKQRTRWIPAKIQRELWARDGGQCQHPDPVTKRLCGSRFQVQADHIIAFVDGGQNTLENLQLRCATHNRLRAVKRFGRQKMSQYLPLLESSARQA